MHILKVSMNKSKRYAFFIYALIIICAVILGANILFNTYKSNAMPFYSLHPKSLCVRACFTTGYKSSLPERKHNIELAVKSLNNTLVDVGGEFSFNNAVGERSEKRGYKEAKIIVNGKFTDGVGGGVCQVSTSLYNAVLLADLKVTEYHPHSLAVSYVDLSFDAMVNSGSADFRFINDTDNPIIIYASADGDYIKITLIGEKNKYDIERKSKIIEELQWESETVANNGLIPDLSKNEKRIITYGKKGFVSEGHIVKKLNGKIVSDKIIRKDKYKPVNEIIAVEDD